MKPGLQISQRFWSPLRVSFWQLMHLVPVSASHWSE